MAKKKHSNKAGKSKVSWTGGGSGVGAGLIALIVLAGIVVAVLCAVLEGRSNGGAVSPVRLNEIMSDTVATPLSGRNGSDWIEIINAGDKAVDLNQYALSLDSKPADAYVFPSRRLAPGETCVVYATGSRGEDTAPFKLPSSGGATLTLLLPNGGIADSVVLPELKADEAYARDETGAWQVTTAATPGLDNDSDPVAAKSVAVDSPVRFSEVMSSNPYYFVDEDGQAQDYIELRNTSSRTVDLTGWTIADGGTRAKRWTFPHVSIPAGGYLAIHCSGKDRVDDAAHLHTSFKLSRKGETLTLCDENGARMDELTIPAIEKGQAYSYADGVWTKDLAPTPGTANVPENAARARREAFGTDRGVVISELMASSTEEGGDWIEIFNGSGSAVDIGSWGLSDRAGKPRKWRFPDGTVIGVGQYMLIKLVGIDGTPAEGSLSADFALAAGGDYTVTLAKPDGSIVDAVYVPKQFGGISYGRATDGDGFYFYEEPTPGNPNSSRHSNGLAPQASCSVPGGLFKAGDSFSVTLSAPEGSRVYYTLDCTDPTERSTPYSGPITVSDTTILRTRVYRDGYLPSLIDTVSYLYDVEHGQAFVVSLVSDPDNLYSNDRGIMVMGPNAWPKAPYGKINNGANFWMDWEREGHVELFAPDETPAFSQGCGIKLHGQFSRAEKIKAFKIFARKELGSNRFNYKIFSNRPYSDFQSFLLRAEGQDYDRAFMRDVVLTSLAKDTSLFYQESEPAVCYLNGKYYSMFYLRERVSRFSICQFEGWEGMEDDIDLIKANDIEKLGSNESFEKLIKYIKSSDMTTPEAYAVLDSAIDIQNYIEYMAIEIFSGNGDTLNVKRYRNPKTDGKWRWVLFDLDWGFSVDTNSIGRWLEPGGMGTGKYTDNTLFIGCMKNPTFRDRFLTYFGQQLATTFSSENLEKLIRERNAILEPLWPRYLEEIGQSEKLHNKNMSILAKYAMNRPAKITGYFVEKFGKAEIEKYFGDAILKMGSTASS